MDVYDAIRQRRSLKPEQLLPDPIDRALLDQLFEAANWAPSHGLTEPWRFIVFTGDAKTALAKAVVRTMKKADEAPFADTDPVAVSTIAKMTRPPVILAIICAAASTPKIVEHEEIASTAMAVQNLHLLARSMGLGGYWSSGNKAFDPRMAEFLGITAPSRCLGFFYLGWPAVAFPEGTRRSVADKVTWRS